MIVIVKIVIVILSVAFVWLAYEAVRKQGDEVVSTAGKR